MSATEEKRWPRAEAIVVVRELLAELTPCCECVIVAGSLRRMKRDVGDIELLFVPRMEERQLDLVTRGPVSLAEECIGNWLNNGTLSKRPSATGSFSWGPLNKLAVHRGGVPVDLFATTLENFWMALVIRTGPTDSNVELIQSAARQGLKLHTYGVYERMDNGEKVVPQSEQEVFALAGKPYREPRDR